MKNEGVKIRIEIKIPKEGIAHKLYFSAQCNKFAKALGCPQHKIRTVFFSLSIQIFTQSWALSLDKSIHSEFLERQIRRYLELRSRLKMQISNPLFKSPSKYQHWVCHPSHIWRPKYWQEILPKSLFSSSSYKQWIIVTVKGQITRYLEIPTEYALIKLPIQIVVDFSPNGKNNLLKSLSKYQHWICHPAHIWSSAYWQKISQISFILHLCNT